MEGEGVIVDVAYLPNGDLLVAIEGKGLVIYDESGDQIRHRLSDDIIKNIKAISVDKSGSTIAVLESTPQLLSLLHVYEQRSDEWHYHCQKFSQQMQCVVLTPSGDSIISGSGRNVLFKYDKYGNQKWTKPTPFTIKAMCLDHRNRLVLCSEKEVFIYNLQFSVCFYSSKLSIVPSRDMTVHFSGVCTFSNCSFLILDHENGVVLEINESVEYVNDILKVAGNLISLDAHRQKLLAVVKDRSLYVYCL